MNARCVLQVKMEADSPYAETNTATLIAVYAFGTYIYTKGRQSNIVSVYSQQEL